MAEMILKATGSKLKITNAIFLTSTQIQYDTCLFEFDEVWDAYPTKTAVFYDKPGNEKRVVLDIFNRCHIPSKAFGQGRYLYIGVYGENGSSVLPTQFVEVMYQLGAYIDGQGLPSLDSQIDFFKTIQDYNNETTMLVKRYERWPGVGFMHILVPISGDRYVRYGIERTYTDAYIRLGACSVVSLEEQIVEKERKNYDSRTGTWVVLDENNEYTTTIGDTFTVSFTGTKIDFLHKADDQGGLWEFELDGVQTVQKHCYSATGVNPRKQTLWNGIAPGPHTVVGTFLGAHPSYPVATPRGYISVADPDDPEIYHKTTFRVYNAELNPVEIFEVMPTSNKELAVAAAPTGLTPQFMPYHSGSNPLTAVSQKVYVDGIEVTDWTDDDPKPASVVEVVQDMIGTHTETPGEPMASIQSVHKVTPQGVFVRVHMKFLKDVDFGASYGMMFPINNDFGTELITGYGNRYVAYPSETTVSEDLTDDESSVNFAYVNRGGSLGKPDIIAAVRVEDPVRSYRKGEENRRDPFMQFQHRDIQKLYPTVYASGSNASVGEEFITTMRFIIGEYPLAADMFPGA